jgi:hypothetical protein
MFVCEGFFGLFRGRGIIGYDCDDAGFNKRSSGYTSCRGLLAGRLSEVGSARFFLCPHNMPDTFAAGMLPVPVPSGYGYEGCFYHE